MARAQRILLTVHTSAHWGGLQDWTVGMVRGLHRLGREVGVVTNNDLVAERCSADAATIIPIDWKQWEGHVDEILEQGPWDLTFAQPFASRAMGVHLKRGHDIPLVVMAHGNAADRGYSWVDAADGILLASASLRKTMVAFNGFDDGIVGVLANGASSVFFEGDVAPFRERLSSDGDVKVVVASRLGVDKLNQIPAMEILVETLLNAADVRHVEMQVLGGGPMRNVFESRLRRLTSNPRVKLSMLGWAGETSVRDHMRDALFTVAGGVSGTQSCCLGTASLGAGFRSVVGISTPENMDAMLSTNFGDHAVRHVARSEIEKDIAWMLREENYTQFQYTYCDLMRRERTHEAVALRAASLLDAAVQRSAAAPR